MLLVIFNLSGKSFQILALEIRPNIHCPYWKSNEIRVIS